MNILIIGHYGGENFGDEAMLYSILSRLTKIEDAAITVVTKPRKKFYFSEKEVTYVLPSLFNVFRECLKTDVLILGGGTHFHDGYNKQRLKNHLVYLLKILLIYLMFFLSGKKIYQLGVGYGPFYGRLIRVLSAVSVKLATFTLVRDHASYKWLTNLGIPLHNTDVSFDLVGLHPLFADKLDSRLTVGITYTQWTGVSLTSFAYNELTYNDEFWTGHFFSSIEDLYKKYDLHIKIFVFRGGERESDEPLSRQLYNLLKKIDERRVKLIEYSEETSPFIEEIKSCASFIATRYHSALLAYLCECRLFFIPYHEKLISLSEDIGLNDKAVFRVEKSQLPDLPNRLEEFILNEENNYSASLEVSEAFRKSKKNLSVFGIDSK